MNQDVVGPDAQRQRDADPVVGRYRRDLATADGLVVLHPNWWGKPPAMLAGWLDRVLVPGVAYRLPTVGDLPEPLLRIRRLLVVNTTETAPAREESDFGDPLDDIWRRCVASYLGPGGQPTHVDRRVHPLVSAASVEQRVQWLDETEKGAAALVDDLARRRPPES